MPSPLALDSQVGQSLQRIVEPVCKIGCANHQRELHNLSIVVVLPQVVVSPGADSGGAACDALRIQDGRLFLLIEQRAALVELERLNLFGSDPDPLRRSGVCARSILAAVDQRGFQIGQLFVARLDSAFVDYRCIQR